MIEGDGFSPLFPRGDTLVVWRLDRFGRSLKDLVTKIEALDERDVEFVSLTEGIDTTAAQGRLPFHLFGALASLKCARSSPVCGPVAWFCGATTAGISASTGRRAWRCPFPTQMPAP